MASSVPEGIVELLSCVPRIILSSKFEPHSSEWRKSVARGRILATSELLRGKISVDEYSVRSSAPCRTIADQNVGSMVQLVNDRRWK